MAELPDEEYMIQRIIEGIQDATSEYEESWRNGDELGMANAKRALLESAASLPDPSTDESAGGER